MSRDIGYEAAFPTAEEARENEIEDQYKASMRPFRERGEPHRWAQTLATQIQLSPVPWFVEDVLPILAALAGRLNDQPKFNERAVQVLDDAADLLEMMEDVE